MVHVTTAVLMLLYGFALRTFRLIFNKWHLIYYLYKRHLKFNV